MIATQEGETTVSNEGLYTSGSTAVNAKVDSIPLRDTYATQPGNDSIGTLISNASQQVSTLVRGEIELAKAEVVGEVKKGAMGGGLFAVAGVIALYSSFFLFFAIAEMLASWMHRGWAFLIVFLVMLALAGLLAFIGFKKIKVPDVDVDEFERIRGDHSAQRVSLTPLTINRDSHVVTLQSVYCVAAKWITRGSRTT